MFLQVHLVGMHCFLHPQCFNSAQAFDASGIVIHNGRSELPSTIHPHILKSIPIYYNPSPYTNIHPHILQCIPIY